MASSDNYDALFQARALILTLTLGLFSAVTLTFILTLTLLDNLQQALLVAFLDEK